MVQQFLVPISASSPNTSAPASRLASRRANRGANDPNHQRKHAKATCLQHVALIHLLVGQRDAITRAYVPGLVRGERQVARLDAGDLWSRVISSASGDDNSTGIRRHLAQATVVAAESFEYAGAEISGLLEVSLQKSGLGPIDYVIIEFPEGSKDFDHVLAQSVLSLIELHIIRVLDLLVIDKTSTGEIDVIEFEDLNQTEVFALGGTLAEILSADDIANLALAIRTGAAAGVIVWENIGIVPMAVAASQAGAQIVAQGRIPESAIVAALHADLREGE